MAQYTPEELDEKFDIEKEGLAIAEGKVDTDQEQNLRSLWGTLRQLADRLVELTPDRPEESREMIDKLQQVGMYATAAAVPESEQQGQ